MKTLILTIGLGLIATLQAQTFPVIEENQNDSGTWYLKAVVADKGIPRKKEAVSVTPMTVRTLEGGSLEVKFTVLIRGQCQNISTILEKTDEPGKYTAYGGKHVEYVIPSSVQDHYIVYSEDKWPRHQTRMAKLMGEATGTQDPWAAPLGRALHWGSGPFLPEDKALVSPELLPSHVCECRAAGGVDVLLRGGAGPASPCCPGRAHPAEDSSSRVSCSLSRRGCLVGPSSALVLLSYPGSPPTPGLQLKPPVGRPGRDPEVNQEALADFEKVAEARGLNADSIFIPKQREACSPGSD
ncbi:von Ebner gland protein 1-like [Erethizon dorsatum]